MGETKLLQAAMRDKGYTLDRLAGEIGMSRTGLFNKIHNKTEFRVSEIHRIARILKLNKADTAKIFFTNRVE